MARLAERCQATGESAAEAIGDDTPANQGRRQFAKSALAASTAAAALTAAPSWWGALAKSPRDGFDYYQSGNVGVVGAGLAGLSCANELVRLGYSPRVYEAADRVGGRVASLRDFFPGQVVERGAEFIGSSHHTMLGYARGLGLPLEDFSRLPGKSFYAFNGGLHSEAQVVEEYRAFAASIREDLATLSQPNASQFNQVDETFDFMSLGDYLDLHGAGPLLRGVIGSAYQAEYGASIDELSSITFLRFVYGDNRTKQSPFGVHGGEFVRVRDGNDRITTGLAAALPRPVALGHRLVSLRKLSSGAIRLYFDIGGRTLQRDHDAVVMTLPFTVLRDVELHPSLGLPASKLQAIHTAGMGDHGKLMLGFSQPVWRAQGFNGTGYSDRAGMPSAWESNPSLAGAQGAVLSGYLGGSQARALGPSSLQADAQGFLSGLEKAVPGISAAAVRNGQGQVQAYGENWSANPFSKGSLTCNRPGYFTTTAHNEAKPVGNLLFAGEHTSSFYEWQGFMEGAALSGLRAAGEVLALARA